MIYAGNFELTVTPQPVTLTTFGQTIAGVLHVGVNTPAVTFLPQGVGTQVLTTSGSDYLVQSGGIPLTITLNTMEGMSATHDIHRGWDITQVAVVQGFNPSANLDTGAFYQAACDALQQITGQRGTQCRSIRVPTYLESFAPEGPINPNAVKTRIHWKGYPMPTYELDSGLSQIESNKDANGNSITVGYQYPANYKGTDGNPSPLAGHNAGGDDNKTPGQGGLFSVPVPDRSFRVSFTILGDINAVSYWSMYVGMVNSVPYNVGVIGLAAAPTSSTTLSVPGGGTMDFTSSIPGPFVSAAAPVPHQWLCTRFHAVSHDGGRSFEAEIVFGQRDRGWDVEVNFIDPQTGKPPPDVATASDSTGNPAQKIVQVCKAGILPTFFGLNTN